MSSWKIPLPSASFIHPILRDEQRCEENPNDAVVLHNLGVALTEEGAIPWETGKALQHINIYYLAGGFFFMFCMFNLATMIPID